MPQISDTPVPQFATAEYGDQPSGPACKACGRALGAHHYRVNGVLTCSECAERLKAKLPTDSHGAFVRGLIFGVGGAVVGLILFVAFALFTGLVIGFVALAVGYIVGKAIVLGSQGQGGRRYQITAVALTYVAVSLSAVPIAVAAHPAALTANIAVLGRLAVLGLASPFLDLSDGINGIIGVVILFVGIRIAWRMTAARPLQIIGPLADTVPVAPG